MMRQKIITSRSCGEYTNIQVPPSPPIQSTGKGNQPQKKTIANMCSSAAVLHKPIVVLGCTNIVYVTGMIANWCPVS